MGNVGKQQFASRWVPLAPSISKTHRRWKVGSVR